MASDLAPAPFTEEERQLELARFAAELDVTPERIEAALGRLHRLGMLLPAPRSPSPAIAAIEHDLQAAITRVPPHLGRGLREHVMTGAPTGAFLTALLSNDFAGAVLRADPASTAALRDLALVLHNDVPPDCWGSHEAVTHWRASGGAEGRYR